MPLVVYHMQAMSEVRNAGDEVLRMTGQATACAGGSRLDCKVTYTLLPYKAAKHVPTCAWFSPALMRRAGSGTRVGLVGTAFRQWAVASLSTRNSLCILVHTSGPISTMTSMLWCVSTVSHHGGR